MIFTRVATLSNRSEMVFTRVATSSNRLEMVFTRVATSSERLETVFTRVATPSDRSDTMFTAVNTSFPPNQLYFFLLLPLQRQQYEDGNNAYHPFFSPFPLVLSPRHAGNLFDIY